MIKLYQFPLSHFCEKARWALDFKGLEYEKVNIVPGPHFKVLKKLGFENSTVPLIIDDEKTVQGSSEIITYLDEKYPEKLLTPKDENLKQEALDWESFVDEEIGPHIRRCFYYILLKYKSTVVSYLSYNCAWHSKILLTFIFPILKKKMTESMSINLGTNEESKIKLHDALNQLSGYLSDRKFLVGDSFTRADLAAASLVAPAFRPQKYGFHPKDTPTELQELADDIRQRAPWLPEMYENYR